MFWSSCSWKGFFLTQGDLKCTFKKHVYFLLCIVWNFVIAIAFCSFSKWSKTYNNDRKQLLTYLSRCGRTASCITPFPNTTLRKFCKLLKKVINIGFYSFSYNCAFNPTDIIVFLETTNPCLTLPHPWHFESHTKSRAIAQSAYYESA